MMTWKEINKAVMMRSLLIWLRSQKWINKDSKLLGINAWPDVYSIPLTGKIYEAVNFGQANFHYLLVYSKKYNMGSSSSKSA